LSGYAFTPAAHTYSSVGANQTAQNLYGHQRASYNDHMN
jgi:hypothetical protein